MDSLSVASVSANSLSSENVSENVLENSASDKSDMNPHDIHLQLREYRKDNLNRVIISHLNINSYNGKFDAFKHLITGNVDVIVLTETKLDDSYPSSQFLIPGFSKPFRQDRDCNGGGVMIYVRDDIPSKQLISHPFPDKIEGIFVELNFRKSKWLLLGTYHPPSQSDSFYFDSIGKAIDFYNNKYDKLILTGDFNAQEEETVLSDFMGLYDLHNLVKDKTCFRSSISPTCIDLFLTQSNSSFQNTKTLSTGLSDFHKMIITSLKTTFPKSKPKEIIYRCYKNFDRSIFTNDLRNKLQSTEDYPENFEKVFLDTLEAHAPIKKKTVRANEAPYMTKALKKAIYRRSRLQNEYFHNRTETNKSEYRRHKNYCSKLYKKERKKYYSNLDITNILDNKKFWKTMKPFFSDKGLGKSTITLVDDGKIISEDKDVANILNDFFANVTKNLDINIPQDCIQNTSSTSDSIDDIIQKFTNHPSIKNINRYVKKSQFSFSTVDLVDIQVELTNLDINKACASGSIPAKLLVENSDVCKIPLKDIINIGIQSNTFPNNLKCGDIIPVYKKDDATNKKNYRPISLLSSVSKIFEKILEKQISKFAKDFLSPFLCGYRKGYSAQQALVSILERWKVSLDKKGYSGAILMDLSKAFDTLNHDLLIAKLQAYGFGSSALKLIKSYLIDRWQRTKINCSFSSWEELLLGVPQGSVLGPLLFNLFINDFFYIFNDVDICNYADDNTIHACDQNLNSLMDKIEGGAAKAVEWFKYNGMQPNPDKCHLLVCGHKHEVMIGKVDNELIIESVNVDLLGVSIDSKLNFDNHVDNICKKVAKMLGALSRHCVLLPFNKRKILMNSFVKSQFSYCPLIWMLHSRKSNKKINDLHYRALRLVYQDTTSSFEQLLEKDKSVSIHHQNIHYLAIEMYKTIKGLGPSFMTDIFHFNDNINSENVSANTRLQSVFYNRFNPRTVYYGSETLRSIGPKIWNIIPEDIKSAASLSGFKHKIKNWKPNDCPCRLCATFVPNLGFI